MAHYIYKSSDDITAARLREQQTNALATIPRSGIISTMDIGDEYCVHPPQKDVVGLRLANLALTDTYGIQGIPSTGPMMKEVNFADGKATVTFDYAADGLTPQDTDLPGFEIAGEDQVFYPATARIVKHKPIIEVSSESVSHPVAVRYAFRNFQAPLTLKNIFGLAAFPFRTDTWNDVK